MRLWALLTYLLLAFPIVGGAQSAVESVCHIRSRVLSNVLSGEQADTTVSVVGTFLRVEWDNTTSFTPPFRVVQVSSVGDTLFKATTSLPSFSVGLRGYAQQSSLYVRSSNDRCLCVDMTSTPPPATWHIFALIGAGFVLLLVGVVLIMRKQRKQLDDERHEIEESSQVRLTKKYDFATVLFSDIQGFTKIAEHMNPEQLIDELDRYFIYFDEIVDRYSVEKIKTIGDAYMCAGGVPDLDSANPIEVVLVGLEMIRYVSERRLEDKGFWNIRVGINTGPVISGHLGNIKKVFDIWGDSVNTASRMESGGEPGKVNISSNTYVKIQDYFDCEYRGRMPVKYKGNVEMYFVNRLKEEYCEPGSTCRPNALLMRKLQILKIADFETKVKDSILRGEHANITTRMDMFLTRVRTLSSMESFTDDEAIMCGVAAIFCFVQAEFPKDTTIIGKSTSRELMRKMHLSDELRDDIERIVAHIGQSKSPANRVEEVLYDAFNEPFGRKDIIPLFFNNYDDVIARGVHMSRLNWLSKQRQVLSDFSFYTDSAKRLVEVPKNKQLEIVDLAMTLVV